MKEKELLKAIEPELLALLSNAPEYGTVGISAVLYKGKITRVITKIDVSKLKEEE